MLVGAPGKVPPEQAAKIMASMRADYDKVTRDYWNKLLEGADPKVREKVSSEMNSVPKPVALTIIDATFRFDPLPSLARYPGPKLIVYTPHGDTPADLQNLVPQIPRKRIDGTSHWPQMDKPDDFNRLMDEFLAPIK